MYNDLLKSVQQKMSDMSKKKKKKKRQYCFVTVIFELKTEQGGTEFINDSQDQVSIPGQVIPKVSKIVLDTSLLNSLR